MLMKFPTGYLRILGRQHEIEQTSFFKENRVYDPGASP